MALIPYQPQNLTTEQADGNILLTWTGSLGATSYQIQRSLDGVNFTNLATTLSGQYIDAYPGVGITYYYQVAGVSGAGTGTYSTASSIVAAPPGEMSFGELKLRARQTADRVGSDFVGESELSSFGRLAMYELYDLLIGSYEDYNIAAPVFINTALGNTAGQFDMPNGLNYLGGTLGGSSGLPASRLYKISGVDLGVNTSNNAWVTVHRYDFIRRNDYVYPNSTSTIYGVYNMRYRPIGTETYTQKISIIPIPAGNQQLRIWYAPVLPSMLANTDLTNIGFTGWLRYPIVRMAKYMLDKEEGSDTSKLDAELLFLKTRIEQMSQNRDIGQADTISETRMDPVYGGTGWGGGGQGGWIVALFPNFISHYGANSRITNPIFFSQGYLSYLVLFISLAYLFYKNPSQFRSRIAFARVSNFFTSRNYFSSLRNHISNIFKRGSKK